MSHFDQYGPVYGFNELQVSAFCSKIFQEFICIKLFGAKNKGMVAKGESAENDRVAQDNLCSFLDRLVCFGYGNGIRNFELLSL
jgi:hypothetical protein